MNLSQAFNPPSSTSSSTDYITDDIPLSQSRTPFDQPSAPSPQHPINPIPTEAPAHQPPIASAQFNGPGQTLSIQPLIVTSDKSSIQDILDKLRSLNSSISDAVDAFMRTKLRTRRFELRKRADTSKISPLMRMAVHERDKTKNRTIEVRNTFQNAILHDLIVEFIYDIIEGTRKREMSYEYAKFREDIESVRNTESFADAQNWVRIAGRLVVTPPKITWKDLAEILTDEMNAKFWQIGGSEPKAQRRNVIGREAGKQHFPDIIEAAFGLSMDIYSRIISQRLKLTIGMKGSVADPWEVELDEDINLVTSVQDKSGDPERTIQGSRSLGLSAELDDGTKKIYLKPKVDYR